MMSCVSIIRYIPNSITPKLQYKLFKKGDHTKIENMPNINMAINITITIPHLTVKSLGVKMA